jgi:hypothetical protein
MLTGLDLQVSLRRTSSKVRVYALDGTYREMSGEQAASVVRDSEEYEGHGTKRRCKLVKRVGAKRRDDPVWQACFRTMSAAVLPPSPDWFQAVGQR